VLIKWAFLFVLLFAVILCLYCCHCWQYVLATRWLLESGNYSRYSWRFYCWELTTKFGLRTASLYSVIVCNIVDSISDWAGHWHWTHTAAVWQQATGTEPTLPQSDSRPLALNPHCRSLTLNFPRTKKWTSMSDSFNTDRPRCIFSCV